MQWIVSKSMSVKITILQVEVARLRPNPWNTNSVGAQNFEKLKGSIEKLGFSSQFSRVSWTVANLRSSVANIDGEPLWNRVFPRFLLYRWAK